jgi:hypothetical protein
MVEMMLNVVVSSRTRPLSPQTDHAIPWSAIVKIGLRASKISPFLNIGCRQISPFLNYGTYRKPAVPAKLQMEPLKVVFSDKNSTLNLENSI